VRYARHQFLSDTLSKQYYDSLANIRMKEKVMDAILRRNPLDRSMEILKFMTSTPQGPDKLATILSGEAKKLLAMDRYERRALSRRKFAIRAFDEARRSILSALHGQHRSPGVDRCGACGMRYIVEVDHEDGQCPSSEPRLL